MKNLALIASVAFFALSAACATKKKEPSSATPPAEIAEIHAESDAMKDYVPSSPTPEPVVEKKKSTAKKAKKKSKVKKATK